MQNKIFNWNANLFCKLWDNFKFIHFSQARSSILYIFVESNTTTSIYTPYTISYLQEVNTLHNEIKVTYSNTAHVLVYWLSFVYIMPFVHELGLQNILLKIIRHFNPIELIRNFAFQICNTINNQSTIFIIHSGREIMSKLLPVSFINFWSTAMLLKILKFFFV